MKTIDYSYFIERYNAGEMDEAQKVWFQKELEGNESLQKEVMLRRKTDKLLQRKDIQDLRGKLNAIERTRKIETTVSVKSNAPRFRYAAIITGAVVIGSLILQYRPMNSRQIFDNYLSGYENTETSRSLEPTYDKAVDYFNRKDYLKAIDGFQTYLKQQPENTRYEFLLGVSNMEIKNYPDAELSFNKVLKKGASLYQEQANWYLAGCYIGMGQKEQAIKELKRIAGSESIYRTKAKKILRHI
jgi:TolA-binding protein